MNYYEHHLGDYAEATAHLSIIEDGAYSRLLRKIYATERALPSEKIHIYRLIAARTKDEKRAVDTVLAEFFELQDDGWHNARADAEIARFLDGEPEREVKKANEDNRMKRHRDERAKLFQTLTAAGGHAAWNIPIADLRELVSTVTGIPVTKPATPVPPSPATAPATPATATQTPVTRHQSPVKEKESPPPSGAPPAPRALRKCPPSFELSDADREWARIQAPRIDLAHETAKFRDHTFVSARSDWPATWRNWIRKASESLPNSQQRLSTTQQRVATLDALTGRSHSHAKQSDPADFVDVDARVIR